MRLLGRLCDELSENERASMGCAESVEATAEATVHCLCRAGTAVSSMFAHSVSDLTRGDVQGCSPDAEESLRCKDRGSGLFKKGKLQDAAQEWSMALRLNDEQGQAGSRMAAILYSNRAQCMLKLGLHEAALNDATCATDCDATYCKSWWRRAIALKALGRTVEARVDALQALQLAGDNSAQADEIQRFVAELAKEEAEEMYRAPREVSKPGGLANHDGNAAAVLEQGSVNVKVAEIHGCGRGLVAGAGGVRAGEVILREKAAAMVLNKSKRMTHCSVCLQGLDSLSVCAVVSGKSPLPLFCSLTCKREYLSSRCVEVAMPWANVLPDNALLAVRLAIAWTEPSVLSNTSTSQEHLHYEAHLDPLSASQRVETAVLAVVAAACWQASARSGEAGIKDLVSKASLVLRAMLVIETNSFAVCGAVRWGQAEAWRVGRGVYVTASMLNHSCRPNVCVSFDNRGILVARALRDLKEGEEATHCYGPQQGSAPLSQRRQELESCYHFSCACEACCEEESMEGGCRMLAVACPLDECRGRGGWICGLEDSCTYNHRHGRAACQQCGHLVDTAVLSKAANAVSAWDNVKVRVSEAMGCKRHGEALTLVKEWLKDSRLLLHTTHRSVGDALHACCMAYAAMGDAAQAAQYCYETLSNLQARYPDGGLVLAQEYAFCSALLLIAGRVDDAKAKAGEAGLMLERHYGSDDPLTQAVGQIKNGEQGSGERLMLLMNLI